MKKILTLLLVIVAAFSLAACGDNATTVTFWHTMGKTTNPSEGGQALLEKFIKEFEAENPGVKIKHESKGSYDDLASAVSKALVAGNQPTMSYSYTDHVAAYLRTNKVQPLDELINHPEYGLTEEQIADYVPAFLDEGRVFDTAGTLYSLPFSKSTEVMFYNKKFLKANNITELDGNKDGEYVILTWEEAEALSKKINASGKLVSGYEATFGYDSSNNHYITASAQGKIPYTGLPTDTSNGVLFNNDQVKAMVGYFKTLYDNDHFTTKDMLGGSNTSNFFLKEQIIFSIGSTGGTKYNIPAENGLFDPSDVGIAPIPFYGAKADLANYKVIQQGPNINLFKKADQNEVIAAWKFLKYITEAEQQAQWSMATGYSPVRLSTYDVPSYADYLDVSKLDLTTFAGRRQQVFVEVLKAAQYLSEQNYFFVSPAFNKSSKARAEVGNILKFVFGGTKTVQKAFQDSYDATVY